MFKSLNWTRVKAIGLILEHLVKMGAAKHRQMVTFSKATKVLRPIRRRKLYYQTDP
jgi:hypothetical protein